MRLIYMEIFGILQQHRQGVPIDYLAHRIERGRNETEACIRDLINQGEVSQKGDTVFLRQPDKESIAKQGGSNNDETTEATIETTIKDIKDIVDIIEETLRAPKALPNRKNALRDYVAQLKEAALRLGTLIEGDE